MNAPVAALWTGTVICQNDWPLCAKRLAVFVGALWRSQGILLCPLRVEGLDRFYGCLGIRARLCGPVEYVDGLVIVGIGQRNRNAPKDRDVNMGRSRSR